MEDLEDMEVSGINSNPIHIRIQMRNGRKCLTTVSDLPMTIGNKKLNFEKITTVLKKEFSTSGATVDVFANGKDEERTGRVIQVQGDFRHAIKHFLWWNGIAEKEGIIVHGA